MTNRSVIAVQVFDQKKFKKKDQGFLGIVKVQVADVFDISVGGDGRHCLLPSMCSANSFKFENRNAYFRLEEIQQQ